MINRVWRKLLTKPQLVFLKSSAKSAQSELINVPASKYADHRTELKENIWRDVDVTGKVTLV